MYFELIYFIHSFAKSKTIENDSENIKQMVALFTCKTGGYATLLI